METIVVILLAIIAYILWRIYRQKEDEKQAITDEKFDTEQEQQRKEKFKDYPHLFGNVDDSWIDTFSSQADRGIPLLKVMFFLMVHESARIDYSEGSAKYDSLWDVTKELLEHLEKYHEGSLLEHEIALTVYWQKAATEMEKLIEESPNTGSLSSGAHTSAVVGGKIEKAPFTDIEKIASLFPKKTNHPKKEITFFNKDGSFPRKSKGSAHIDEKIKALGF
jgi:hypothetical protein